MRAPIASGVFYERDFDKLNQQIDLAFEQGPGTTPLEKRDNSIFAAVVPNLNYLQSAITLSWAYKEIAEASQPFTYIILGAFSKPLDKILLSINDFSTPFGAIKNNRDLANKLLDQDTIIDENSHSSEFSIELQLPFLQYVNKKDLNTLRILPILISTLNPNLIKNLAAKLVKMDNTVIIVSSNLLHYGPLYNFAPFKYNIKTEFDNLSNRILDSLLSVNSDNLFSIMNKYGFYLISPLLVLLETLKLKKI